MNDVKVCRKCGQEKTIDVIPLSRGGEHSMENIKVAHRVCNTRKNNRLLSVVS